MIYMKNEIKKTSKEYYFYKAIDGNIDLDKYKFNIIQKWYDPYTSKAMTKGEIGCALSHYFIWKEMLEKDIDNLIILEDDIIIDNNFDKLLEKYRSQINEEYDMLYLGRKAINKETEVFLTDNIVKPKYSYWTCGYLLKKSGAKKLIESNYINGLIPVDEFLSLMFGNSTKELYNRFSKYYNNSGSLKALSVNPYLIYPKNDAFFDSDTYNSQPIKINPYIFDNYKFIVLTVGTNNTDGLNRFKNYCSIYGFYYKILGFGEKWIGGKMNEGTGGGQKINLLKKELDNYTIDELNNTFILFTDCYDVIICGSPYEVIYKFKKMNKPIIFSAEKYCWPDLTLKSKYKNNLTKYKYLNSGGFIGLAKDIYNILNNVVDNSDDQLYYTKYFLENNNNNNIILDNYCEIFQTLNGVNDDLEINYKKSRIINKIFNTEPIFIHGNGPLNIKLYLNKLENYTGSGWNEYYHSYLDITKNYKKIFIAHFSNNNISKTNIDILEYPTNLLIIKNYNLQEYKKSIDDFLNTDSDYYFHILDGYIFKNKNTLIDCLNQNKNIIAPLFRIKNEAWSNFWGDIDTNGYYKRSFDYFDILNRDKKGCWNVPYITGVFLINKQTIINNYSIFNSLDNFNEDKDMILCEEFRNNGIFMYLINYEEYGLINENIEINLFSFDKEYEWEQKYLHPLYISNKNSLNKLKIDEICQDVFNFPLFSKEFCYEIINLCEKYNNWSPGNNNHIDHRLGKNGYENVPTQDIHLNQIEYDKIWEKILFKYITPIVKLLYNNYQTKGTNINFVVKYSLNGQKELKPHHDASVYTINIALNNDFEGGGCRFIRQNFDCINKEIGYVTIHPGRLTHYHQGLKITKGIRYILVSFVN